MRAFIYDENGGLIQVTPLVAAMWMEENNGKRTVAYDRVEGGGVLSTVFLVYDVGHDLGLPPILYESLWLEGPLEGNQRRYSTLQEALAGHQEMLQEYERGTEFERTTDRSK